MKTKLRNARTFVYSVRYLFAIAMDDEARTQFMKDVEAA